MTDTVVPGYGPSAIAAEALRHRLLISTLLLSVRTAIPVEVIAVHPGEGSPPEIGTIDVKPLVQTVDGSGNLWPMPPVYGVPFLRIQSGGTAVVVDPSKGDIGLAVTCDRDISSVLASGGQQSGPGSARTHNVSDLVYALSLISAAEVTQYLLMNSSGITLLSPGTITIQGAQINFKGPVNANNATISSAGEITDAAGKVLGTHDHGPGTYVAPSGGGPITGDSGPPL